LVTALVALHLWKRGCTIFEVAKNNGPAWDMVAGTRFGFHHPQVTPACNAVFLAADS